MAEQQEKSAKKARKKKWFGIVADGIFENTPLGETLVYSAEDLIGRIVGVNLMTLTNDVKQQNITVRFRVHKAQGDTVFASLVSYSVLHSSIRRMVRKNVERVDSSFVVESKDGVKMRVKPLLVARNATSVSMAKLLRRMCMEFLVSQINNMSYDDFARHVLGKTMQAQMRAYLKRVYPLKACEIRSFEITSTGTPVKLIGDRIVVPEPRRKDERPADEPQEGATQDEAPQEAQDAEEVPAAEAQ